LTAPLFDRTTILAHLEELNTELVNLGDAKRAVVVIAERHQLSRQWLNDESKAFLPADFDDTRADVVTEHSHLIVRVPHADDVFVMKLNASRGEGDLADMVRLWPTCSFQSASEVVRRYATAYPREIDDPFLAIFIAEHVIARAEAS